MILSLTLEVWNRQSTLWVTGQNDRLVGSEGTDDLNSVLDATYFGEYL
jgi:hypothetical protein